MPELNDCPVIVCTYIHSFLNNIMAQLLMRELINELSKLSIMTL